MALTRKEKTIGSYEEYEEFFVRNQKIITHKIPAVEFPVYLSLYDEKKYGIAGSEDQFAYSRFTSPWHYKEEILNKYKDRFLYHGTPPLDPDGRFLTFVSQLDPETDTHAGFSVAARDVSDEVDTDNNLEFIVSVDIYTRSCPYFVNFLKENKDIQSEIPDYDDKPVGFGK